MENEELIRKINVIYKTNLDLAYAKGKYAQQKKLADAGLRPYLKYIASTSEEQNPFHKQFYGLVFRFDDPIWKIIYPPSRFGCECSTRSLSQKEVDEENITISNGSKILIKLMVNNDFRNDMKIQRSSKFNIFSENYINHNWLLLGIGEMNNKFEYNEENEPLKIIENHSVDISLLRNLNVIEISERLNKIEDSFEEIKMKFLQESN